MTDSRPNPPPPRSGPPRVPFPSLHPGERVRGSGILEELGARHGALLWESYRNVGDWAVRPKPGRTAAMFGGGAAERRTRQIEQSDWRDGDAGLRAALEAIRDLLAQPRETRGRTVAGACRRISAWAREQGALATEFYFAAAAGMCTPDDAAQAYRAGKLARDLARWDAAEVWLEHAMSAARRRRDRETQGMALLGLGRMYYLQGNYARAREAYAAGLLHARRFRLRQIEGYACHELFIVLAEDRSFARAEEYAHLAAAAYGPGNDRVKDLGHDVAFSWLSRGCAARALTVLNVLLPLLRDPQRRIHVLASVGHAAAVCGDRARFGEAWREAWSLVETPAAECGAAPVLLELALGAACLGEYTRAETAARAALRRAVERGEMDLVARAEELLERIRLRDFVQHRPAPGRRAGYEEPADQLAETLVRSLTGAATG